MKHSPCPLLSFHGQHLEELEPNSFVVLLPPVVEIRRRFPWSE